MTLDLVGKTIVWIRTDSIGDNVLALPVLDHIIMCGRPSRVIVVCQKHIAELYTPYADRIIGFVKPDIYVDSVYRNWIIKQIQSEKPDVAINTVYSREPLTDELVHASGAPITIGIDGDCENIAPAVKRSFDMFYTHLVKMPKKWESETMRHYRFLEYLFGDLGLYGLPLIGTKKEDHKFADKVLKGKPRPFIAFFPGAQHEFRVYRKLELALPKDATIVGLGAASEAKFAQRVSSPNFINLFGKTTLMQAAAIIAQCDIAVGAESGLAHIACAQGVPNVIVIGGGHFGRFMPYSANTILVTHAMDCFGCSWRCTHSFECIRKIKLNIVRDAIKLALEKKARADKQDHKSTVFYTGDNTKALQLVEGEEDTIEWVKYS